MGIAGKVIRSILNSDAGRGLVRALLQKNLSKIQTVSFLCKGNICRSPYAEEKLRTVLPLNSGIIVNSCGWYATPGKPANAQAVESSKAFGIDLSRHRTENVTNRSNVDLFVLFEPAHLLKLSPKLWSRCTLLSLFESGEPDSLTIPDPFEKGDEEFRRCYARINGAITNLSRQLTSST